MRPIVPLLAVTAFAAHGGLLTGRSGYDPAAHLFTYTYALDNTAGPWPVTEVSILVAPDRADYDLRPVAWSAPPGWEFGTSVSGGIASPPYNEAGTFWFWYNADGLRPGERAEFSFASSYGPAGSGNNYFVYAPEAERDGRDGVIEYGRTAAPVVTPEPASVTLGVVGLGLFGLAVAWSRRHRIAT